jgi:hypothetical protein
MVKNIFKKSLVIGIIILFTAAGVGATIAPNINEKKDIINILNTSDIKLSQSKGEWSDNFDSYEAGSKLDGQGGWQTWDNLPENTGYVSDVQSRSSPNSAEIAWFSGTWADMVYMFSDVNSGIWRIIAWQYIPSNMQGNTFFILMNTYTPGVTHNNPDWSLQLVFSVSVGTVSDYNDATKTLPIITNQWVQIRVEIDFESDLQVVYYNNEELLTKSWTAGVQEGGAKNLACVDLYADQTTSTSVYYDDMVLEVPLPLSCNADGPYEALIDQEIQFDGTVEGGLQPYEYLWDFGDGNTATTLDPVNTYSEPGTYTVKLTVTDYSQNVVSDETTATIIELLPVIEIGTITGGLFKVSATIKNTGNKDATGVVWSIGLNGGLIILGKTSSGTVDIPQGGQKTVQTGMILGIGKTMITVSASVPESSDTKSKSALVLGFYII